jgi:hypothetical protein
MSSSVTFGAVVSTSHTFELQSQSERGNVPVIRICENQRIPFSNKTDHGGAGGKYISAADAVPHISVTAVSTLTFAIVIALFNYDGHDSPTRVPVIPRQSFLHKILFRAIISPNAP